MSQNQPANIHPGEILREEFLLPAGLSAYRVARDLHVPLPRLNDIVREKRGISAEMALRLATYFGTSVELWTNLQTRYEVLEAERRIGPALKEIQPRRPDSLGNSASAKRRAASRG